MAAELPAASPVLVAPALANERNTIREGLVPVAGWQIDDVRFDFDSSFVLPDAKDEFALLAALRHDFPDCRMSLFGHADPVGNDEYNKVLSGRRAMAVYGVLTRDLDLWEHLYSAPHGKDHWGEAAFGAMRRTTGAPDPDGAVPKGAAERRELYSGYMDAICQDLAGRPVQFSPKTDFLAGGADQHGKGDVQGCGEFNPEMLLPRAASGTDADTTERNAANAPNRRVVAFLFQHGITVAPSQWPCPRATEDTAGCRKRLWSNAAARRLPGTDLRRQLQTQDTFTCRFYERLATPQLEVGRARLVSITLKMQDPEGQPLKDEPWTFAVAGVEITGKTAADGVVQVRVPSTATSATLNIAAQDIPVELAAIPPVTTPAGVQYRLRNLGYYQGNVDGVAGPQTRDAVARFQNDRQHAGVNLPMTGEADAATQQELVRYHGS